MTFPFPPKRPMTDLRAIEIAIEVMEGISGFAFLVGKLNGFTVSERDAAADEITAAVLRLGTIRADLVREGRHSIEG